MRLLLLVLALLGALAFVSCGDDDDGEETSAPPPAATVTVTEPTTTPEPTATAPSATTPPEDQPGGAGDENQQVVGPISVFAGRIVPRTTEVQTGKRLSLITGDADAYTLTITPALGGKSELQVTSSGAELDLAGAQPGSYQLAVDGKQLGTIEVR